MKTNYILSNGITAKILITKEESLTMLLTHPQYLEDLAKEIRAFNKHFWNSEEMDWSDVIDDADKYIKDFFKNTRLLMFVGGRK